MQLSHAPSAFLMLVTRASFASVPVKSTMSPANKTERRTTVALVFTRLSPGLRGGGDGSGGGGGVTRASDLHVDTHCCAKLPEAGGCKETSTELASRL
jgi:hypothetical protein